MPHLKLRLACSAVLLAVSSLASPVVQAQSLAQRGEPVTLNFANAEIEAVARAMATMTGRNMVVDPRVKGNMNLNTERPVSPAVAYNLFLATLRLQGFTVVEVGGIDKVVPEADAKLQGGSVLTQGAGPAAGQLVTQIFKLSYETANNLVPVLRPLISPNNTINVNPGNNSLVITDYSDNLQRIARIVAALDVANATDVEVLPLKHAIAADLAPLVVRLMESGGAAAQAGQVDNSYKTTVVAEPRSNSLVLRAANAARVAQVKALVEKLDQPTAGPAGTGGIYVVHLKNADAVKLAATLRAAVAADSRSATSASLPNVVPIGAAATAGASSALGGSGSANSTGGQIQADVATNSLIISAPEPQYRQLRAVIERLDTRRAQVFVESLIAEVSADKASQIGIQWQTALGSKGSNVGLLGTNFSTNQTANIINLSTTGANGTVAASAGLNYGLLRNINGVYVLGALANLLQTTGDGNVLSTPTLLTLDNEEASIVIGQNVPFLTGQYTNTSGSGGVTNPFQTIERKDVGIKLKVRPQINENGTVKLIVSQEVSNVDPASKNATSGPTTNKRAVDTQVLVEDGSIVVLGGLLQDEYSGNEDKVPGLGDVPLLGNLFKSESRSRKKTNLMLFLRPVVVRDGAATEQLSLDRYEQMRSGQGQVQLPPSIVSPVNSGAQLPATTPRAPVTPPAAKP